MCYANIHNLLHEISLKDYLNRVDAKSLKDSSEILLETLLEGFCLTPYASFRAKFHSNRRVDLTPLDAHDFWVKFLLTDYECIR